MSQMAVAFPFLKINVTTNIVFISALKVMKETNVFLLHHLLPSGNKN